MKLSKTVLFTLVGATLALAGCNAVQGLGRDIESVGRAGEQALR